MYLSLRVFVNCSVEPTIAVHTDARQVLPKLMIPWMVRMGHSMNARRFGAIIRVGRLVQRMRSLRRWNRIFLNHRVAWSKYTIPIIPPWWVLETVRQLFGFVNIGRLDIVWVKILMRRITLLTKIRATIAVILFRHFRSSEELPKYGDLKFLHEPSRCMCVWKSSVDICRLALRYFQSKCLKQNWSPSNQLLRDAITFSLTGEMILTLYSL